MKYCSIIFLFAISLNLSAQEIKPTVSFTINGRVKSPVTITIDELKSCKIVSIGDVTITNHMGELRGTARSLKGVLLQDVLQFVEIDAESPKVMSEYFFVCKASDGYTVGFSWNEIFNTVTGDGVYVITEKEGKSLAELPEGILLISASDFKTGRRHVKSVSTIEVFEG